MRAYLEAHCNKTEKKCLQPIDGEEFTLSDGESAQLTITKEARESVHKVKLDGCLLPRNQPPQRCDWVLCLEDFSLILLIELKSANFDHEDVVRQFLSSESHLGIEGGNNRYILVCYTRRRRRGTTQYDFLREQFKENFRWIETKSGVPAVYKLSELKQQT